MLTNNFKNKNLNALMSLEATQSHGSLRTDNKPQFKNAKLNTKILMELTPFLHSLVSTLSNLPKILSLFNLQKVTLKDKSQSQSIQILSVQSLNSRKLTKNSHLNLLPNLILTNRLQKPLKIFNHNKIKFHFPSAIYKNINSQKS